MDRPAPSPARRGRPFRLWVVLATLLLLALGAAIGSLAWMLGSEPGTRWILGQVSGLRVQGLRGPLLGSSLQAERVEFVLSGQRPGLLVLHEVGWSGLQWRTGGPGQWLHIEIARLHAARVDLRPAQSAEPAVAPRALTLPFELRIDAVEIGALHTAALGTAPLHDLRGRLHLGADGGREHRVDGLRADWQEIGATGSVQIDSAAPLALAARLTLRRPGPITPWNAEFVARGPLEAFSLQARLQGEAAGPRPAPLIQADAGLRPFAAWPLGTLEASTKALDLSAIDPAWPATAIDARARVRSEAADRPAEIAATLANAAAGRWNEARVPLRQLNLVLRARPDDPRTLEVQTFDAELGGKTAAGRIGGRGRWAPTAWNLSATLADVEPARLDARAPAMRVSGPIELAGSGFGGVDPTAARVSASAELSGRATGRQPGPETRLQIEASGSREGITLKRAEARAGGARATLDGKVLRATDGSGWRADGRLDLAQFDPQPWWPGRGDAPWRRGPHRLNAQGQFELTLADRLRERPLAEQLAGLRGTAALRIADSLLAGVALGGEAQWRDEGRGTASANVALDAAGNTLRAQGTLARDGRGSDQWALQLAAPAVARLAPLARLFRPEAPSAAGSMTATARLDGRWPALRTEGQLEADGLRLADLAVQKASGRWTLSAAPDAPLQAQLTLRGAQAGGRTLENVTLALDGSARAHTLKLEALSNLRPPAWVDEVQPVAAGASAPATGTQALLSAQGGLRDDRGGWSGRIGQLELKPTTGSAGWLRSSGFDATFRWAGGPARVELQPGSAALLGATLRWKRMLWQAGDAPGMTALIDADAEVDPFAVAPWLVRAQPEFGWGGDLTLGGRLRVRSTPSFAADIVVERGSGDLSVTDESGTQTLGLTDLRLGLNAADGVWSFTQGLAGRSLGVAAGAVVARTSPQALWPAADTPIEGVLELRVANLGTWGPWVPTGWRLGGALNMSAAIGGRFAAPEYTGVVRGEKLSVRNFVEGVNVTDGEVAIALQGARARIERLEAKAGGGSVRLAGEASLGEAPQADLRLVAERFEVLGRVDRRIVASGDARLQLDRDTLALGGRFVVDSGLVDFTRRDAPSLSDDVVVVRAGPPGAKPAAAAAARAPSRLPRATLDLRVNLGEQLRLRGRGLDTGLRGEVHITSPRGRLAIDGDVSASGGTYAAYGQKLVIDKGLVSFSGPADNPRLDIEATRPNLDVRVGVSVTGRAVDPRIRLFSEPEMAEVDKLSWLVLGRASDGLGSAETALLQRAAMALLAGEGDGFSDQLIGAIGLDEISVRQADGEVRDTVISLGKQLSARWYVGYERGLNATAGTWQLVYRVARRFTLRAQSGLDNSLDAIWTWRWQ